MKQGTSLREDLSENHTDKHAHLNGIPVWRVAVVPTKGANALKHSWGVNGKIFVGGSNEPYGMLYHNLASVRRQNLRSIDRLISVCGSFMAPLSVLSGLDIRQSVVFFDRNPDAIAYSQMVLRLVDISASPAEFLGRLYGRDAEAFERSHGRITADNQELFLQEEVSPQILQDTISKLSHREAQIYHATISRATNATCFSEPGIRPGEQHVLDEPLGWTKILDKQSSCVKPVWTSDSWATPLSWHPNAEHLGPHTVGFGHAFWMYGSGWLTDQASFDAVKQRLPLVRFMNAELEEVLAEPYTGKAKSMVLYIMDMISAGHSLGYSKLPLDVPQNVLERWTRTQGVDDFVLLQSMGCSVSRLCTRASLKNSVLHVESCSADWDSSNSSVLSSTVGQMIRFLEGGTHPPKRGGCPYCIQAPCD